MSIAGLVSKLFYPAKKKPNMKYLYTKKEHYHVNQLKNHKTSNVTSIFLFAACALNLIRNFSIFISISCICTTYFPTRILFAHNYVYDNFQFMCADYSTSDEHKLIY